MEKKSIWRSALPLLVFSIIAGLCLGLVYLFTKPGIDKAELNFKLQSIKKVLEDPITGELLVASSEIPDSLKELEELVWRENSEGVLAEYDSLKAKVHSPAYLFRSKKGEEIYVLEGSSVGYGGSVVVLAAFVKVEDDFRLNGIRVTSYSQETPGLGAKIGEEKVMKRFYPVEPEGLRKGLKVNKDANVVPTEDEEKMRYLREHEGIIQTSDVMTGATLTPRAVVNAINAMYRYLKEQEG